VGHGNQLKKWADGIRKTLCAREREGDPNSSEGKHKMSMAKLDEKMIKEKGLGKAGLRPVRGRLLSRGRKGEMARKVGKHRDSKVGIKPKKFAGQEKSEGVGGKRKSLIVAWRRKKIITGGTRKFRQKKTRNRNPTSQKNKGKGTFKKRKTLREKSHTKEPTIEGHPNQRRGLEDRGGAEKGGVFDHEGNCTAIVGAQWKNGEKRGKQSKMIRLKGNCFDHMVEYKQKRAGLQGKKIPALSRSRKS